MIDLRNPRIAEIAQVMDRALAAGPLALAFGDAKARDQWANTAQQMRAAYRKRARVDDPLAVHEWDCLVICKVNPTTIHIMQREQPIVSSLAKAKP
jgi:hypothetical protein